MIAPTLFILENFDPTTQLDWRILNDGVMGGLSESRMEKLSDGIGQFSGTVSLRNNGGFASTRALLPKMPKNNYTKVILKVKGDGKKYSFRLRSNHNFDGVSYRQDFSTQKGEWQEIALPLADFVPTWRGRVVRDVPPIIATQIQQIGFLISDKQEGAFELQIDWIGLE
ncbi:MAG: CIA30 family protein [Bacteroidota bacterium]